VENTTKLKRITSGPLSHAQFGIRANPGWYSWVYITFPCFGFILVKIFPSPCYENHGESTPLFSLNFLTKHLLKFTSLNPHFHSPQNTSFTPQRTLHKTAKHKSHQNPPLKTTFTNRASGQNSGTVTPCGIARPCHHTFGPEVQHCHPVPPCTTVPSLPHKDFTPCLPSTPVPLLSEPYPLFFSFPLSPCLMKKIPPLNLSRVPRGMNLGETHAMRHDNAILALQQSVR